MPIVRILQVNINRWRRRRHRQASFVLVVFTLLACGWQALLLEAGATNGPAMHDVDFDSYHTTVVVDAAGQETVRESVEVNFKKPQSYVRVVGELAANDAHIRYFSHSLGASIDGKRVSVREWHLGEGGHYYAMGSNLLGRHRVDFAYRVDHSLIRQGSNVVFRSRLLPRYSFSTVKDFDATVNIEGMRPSTALCWTSEDLTPTPVDRCDFSALTSDQANIAIAAPAYLRPVRFVVDLTPRSVHEQQLPWTGFWDNTLGRHWYTPALALIVALAVSIVGRLKRPKGRAEVTVWVTMLLAYVIVVGTVTRFTPGIALLPAGAALLCLLPSYLRRTEHRYLVSPEEVQRLIEEQEGTMGE